MFAAKLWSLAAIIPLAAVPMMPDAGHWNPSPKLAVARAATSEYHRTDVALAEGYALPPSGPLHECISALEGPHAAMGYHWINSSLVGDDQLNPATPEVLVYEPTKNGKLRLVALEYVVFADAWEASHPDSVPSLFGRPLKYVPEPNRYELPAFYEIHAWVWKHNPWGMFADHNPRVSCEGQSSHGHFGVVSDTRTPGGAI